MAQSQGAEKEGSSLVWDMQPLGKITTGGLIEPLRCVNQIFVVKFGKHSVISSSYIISAPFFPYSSGAPVLHVMVFFYDVPQVSESLFSFLFFFLLFVPQTVLS